MNELTEIFVTIQTHKRITLEPNRVQSIKQKLISLGWTVQPGPDHKSYKVVSPNGKEFNFWPYAGYFAGYVQGRGFKNLIEAGK